MSRKHRRHKHHQFLEQQPTKLGAIFYERLSQKMYKLAGNADKIKEAVQIIEDAVKSNPRKLPF